MGSAFAFSTYSIQISDDNQSKQIVTETILPSNEQNNASPQTNQTEQHSNIQPMIQSNIENDIDSLNLNKNEQTANNIAIGIDKRIRNDKEEMDIDDDDVIEQPKQ